MAHSEPTLSDVLDEVQKMNNRVVVLENWKVNEDAYRAALARVKEEEAKEKQEKSHDILLQRRTEIMKQVGIVLGLITVILYAYMATNGIQAP